MYIYGGNTVINFKKINTDKIKEISGMRFKFYDGWWYGADDRDKILIKCAVIPNDNTIRKLLGNSVPKDYQPKEMPKNNPTDGGK